MTIIAVTDETIDIDQEAVINLETDKLEFRGEENKVNLTIEVSSIKT